MINSIDLEKVKKENIIIPYSISVLTQSYYDLQKILKSNCFFEIGAFEADFSRTMKGLFSTSKVYAFEASPYCYDNYKNLNSSIEYLNLAVSDKEGEIYFSLQDKNLSDQTEIEKVRGNNSILDRNDDTSSYKKIKVKTTTLDSFIEKESLTTSSFSLWVDVEGANKNVLTGFEKYLKNVQSILIEVEDCEFWKQQWLSQDVIKYLHNFGLIPIVRDFESNQQYNIVFINNFLLNNHVVSKKINDWIIDYLNKTLYLH